MKPQRQISIWWFAFGYFAAYVPYSFTTKALSKGLFESMQGARLAGFSLLPISVLAGIVAMLVFLTAMGWWKHARHTKVGPISIPRPGLWTFLSGICTAGIIGTTTLAYTFAGISIVFAMLLMRGGVLIIAPVVDLISGRKARWFSFAALVLSMSALVVAFSEDGGYQMTLVAGLNIGLYLASYFIRLRFMSKLAKSEDPGANRRYFVEEHMVGAPILFLVLGVFALINHGEIMGELRAGFTEVWSSPVLWAVILVGVLSEGTGVFGSLIFLDKRENTFCVPVNRSSSILAGVMASTSLAVIFDLPMPSTYQLIGAGLIIAAILFLTIPPMVQRRRDRLAGMAPVAGAVAAAPPAEAPAGAAADEVAATGKPSVSG